MSFLEICKNKKKEKKRKAPRKLYAKNLKNEENLEINIVYFIFWFLLEAASVEQWMNFRLIMHLLL